jgi:hypothetical protein
MLALSDGSSDVARGSVVGEELVVGEEVQAATTNERS